MATDGYVTTTFSAFLRKHQIPTPASLVEGKFGVLIVDDDSEIVDLVKAFLERQGGYEISTASDGITAMIEVGRVKPDLLILDIMIPGVDGVEVCRRHQSRLHKQNRSLSPLAAAPRHEKKILQAGADSFMLKPLDLEKLHVEARRLLRVL